MNPVEYTQLPSILTAQNGTLTSQKHISMMKKCSPMPDLRMDAGDYKLIKNNAYIDRYKFKNDYNAAKFMNTDNDQKNGNSLTATLNLSYQMLPNVNLMPPPPHNSNMVNNNNIIGNNFNRRGSWKSGTDLRCNSPQGSESDESCRSYKSRESPPHISFNNKCRNKNNGYYVENSLVCNKFSNSTPTIYYPSMTQNNGHYKPKYFNNSRTNHQHRYDNKKKLYTTDISRRVYGLMERFTSRASMFRISVSPPNLINLNEWDSLNQSIWDVYMAKAQKEDTYIRKLELWKMVYLSIQNVLMRYGLFLVGSTMSGLGLDSSDIDMCLLVRPCLADARNDALSYLKGIYDLLEGCEFIKSREIITAKVPILKFRDATYGFEVDLNCNNSVGIRNTHLMNCYARLDWRVRPLVAIVKLWAQANDINDAKRMTISSYSLALMAIHYLQCGVTPPAIPCLQGMYPDRFSPQIEIHDIDIQADLPPFYSDNKQSVGELFLGFLQYYTYFDYNQFAISVREGSLLSKEECRFARSPKNDATQWKLLCIEEPFDLTNTARSVYDIDTFEHIKTVFRLSYEALHKTKNLNSILPNNGIQR